MNKDIAKNKGRLLVLKDIVAPKLDDNANDYVEYENLKRSYKEAIMKNNKIATHKDDTSLDFFDDWFTLLGYEQSYQVYDKLQQFEDNVMEDVENNCGYFEELLEATIETVEDLTEQKLLMRMCKYIDNPMEETPSVCTYYDLNEFIEKKWGSYNE